MRLTWRFRSGVGRDTTSRSTSPLDQADDVGNRKPNRMRTPHPTSECEQLVEPRVLLLKGSSGAWGRMGPVVQRCFRGAALASNGVRARFLFIGPYVKRGRTLLPTGEGHSCQVTVTDDIDP